MKRFIYFVTGFLVLALAVYAARVPLLKAIGAFLVVEDELKECDVIIVLAGGNGRVKEAAKLYEQGWAKQMIMTGGSSEQEVSQAALMREKAVAAGVPAEDIILEPEAMSTYQHPVYVRPIMLARGFHSAIVVTSPYHLRRSRLVFGQVFGKDAVELIYHAAPTPRFDAQSWWTDPTARTILFSEYGKFAVNFWGRGFSEFVWKQGPGKRPR